MAGQWKAASNCVSHYSTPPPPPVIKILSPLELRFGDWESDTETKPISHLRLAGRTLGQVFCLSEYLLQTSSFSSHLVREVTSIKCKNSDTTSSAHMLRIQTTIHTFKEWSFQDHSGCTMALTEETTSCSHYRNRPTNEL